MTALSQSKTKDEIVLQPFYGWNMEDVQFQKVPAWTDPILELPIVILMKNVPFFFKTLVFDNNYIW